MHSLLKKTGHLNGVATKTYRAKEGVREKQYRKAFVLSKDWLTTRKKIFETINAKPKNKVKADPQSIKKRVQVF